jgi:hypothetical protein
MTVPGSSTTYWARWIEWDAMGGFVTTVPGSLSPGDLLGTLPVPDKDGYSFMGWWYTSETGGEIEVDDEFRAHSTNTRFWARWIPAPVTITWNTNGGTPATITEERIPGYDFDTLPTPSRSGFTFIGWFDTSAVFGGTEITSECRVPGSPAIYWARWARAVVDVDVFAESTWQSHHSTPENLQAWQDEARSIIERVAVPFMTEFEIQMMTPTDPVAFVRCPTWRCGNNSTTCNDTCSIRSCEGLVGHCWSGGRMMTHANLSSSGDLSLILTRRSFCSCRGSIRERPEGLAISTGVEGTVSKGAIVREGYMAHLDADETFWRAVRVTQHEFTHNYGVVKHCPYQCIMAGSFMDDYRDLPNIWCNSCRNIIHVNRNKIGR